MKKFLTDVWKRIYSNRYSSLVGLLLFGGYHAFYHGKIEFSDFVDYVALIPTILLLLMKDHTNNEPK